MTPQKGDILLYVHDNTLLSRAIAFFTGGRFSHVGVAIDETTSIEAEDTDGVQVRHPDFSSRDIVVVPIRDYKADEEGIDAGIKFLEAEVGSRYSYLDCLDTLPLLKALGIAIVVRNRFDCSHLVAEYIKRLGLSYLTLAMYSSTTVTAAVSPNDIARAAGVK